MRFQAVFGVPLTINCTANEIQLFPMFLHAFLERTGVNGALETIVLYFSIQKDLDTVKKRGKTPQKTKTWKHGKPSGTVGTQDLDYLREPMKHLPGVWSDGVPNPPGIKSSSEKLLLHTKWWEQERGRHSPKLRWPSRISLRINPFCGKWTNEK